MSDESVNMKTHAAITDAGSDIDCECKEQGLTKDRSFLRHVYDSGNDIMNTYVFKVTTKNSKAHSLAQMYNNTKLNILGSGIYSR